MFNFNMNIRENSALFQYKNYRVVVDSFDNQYFNVRFGTFKETHFIDTIEATTSDKLNQQLHLLIDPLLSEKPSL